MKEELVLRGVFLGKIPSAPKVSMGQTVWHPPHLEQMWTNQPDNRPNALKIKTKIEIKIFLIENPSISVSISICLSQP